MPAAKKLRAITVRRLRWIIEQLKKHPHQYNQGQFCGTQGCLAGYCLPAITGDKKSVILEDFPWFESSLTPGQAKKIKFYPEGAPGFADFNFRFRTAAKYLHLNAEQADQLFSARWTGEAAKYNRQTQDTDRLAANRAIRRVEAFISSEGAI